MQGKQEKETGKNKEETDGEGEMEGEFDPVPYFSFSYSLLVLVYQPSVSFTRRLAARDNSFHNVEFPYSQFPFVRRQKYGLSQLIHFVCWEIKEQKYRRRSLLSLTRIHPLCPCHSYLKLHHFSFLLSFFPHFDIHI